MKKAKLLTVLGVMLAMGITGCNGGKSSAAPESKPGSSAQPTTSAPAPTTSSKAPSSSTPAQPKVVPDPDGHKFGNDTDVAADATAGTVAYKKASCTENDGFERLKINQSVVKYDKGERKDGTPEGYTKLSSNGDIMSFKFKADKKYMGKLFLYGVMDGYSSNLTKNFCYYQNKPNVEVKVNDEVIDISAQKDVKFQDIFGTEADPDTDNLSPENYALLGNVVLNEGVNEIVYKRVATLNMLIKDFVFIVEPFNEWGPAKAVAADTTAGTVGYNLYTNNLNGTKKIEVKLEDSMLAEGSVNKNNPAGYFKLNANNQSFGFKFKYDSIAYGELYQRGVMDNWTSNNGRNLFSGGSNGADDFEIKVNNKVVPVDPDQKKLTYKDVMTGEADTEKNLSPVTDVLTANIQLANGVNEFTYTRKASYNLALTHIVIIVKDSDHEHAAGDNAAWLKDAEHHWHVCGHEGCNEVIDEAEHTWVDDDSKQDVEATTCDGVGIHYEKCSVCGQERQVDKPSTAEHVYVDGTPANNTDGFAVTPMECSGCHKVGAKMSIKSFTGNTKTDETYKHANGTTVTYKMIAPKAGNYQLKIGAYVKDNRTKDLTATPYTVKVGEGDAAVNVPVSTGTYEQLGIGGGSSINIKQFVLCPTITLAAGENVISIAQGSGGFRLTFGGLVEVYEL